MADIEPVAKVDMDPNFEARLRELRAHAAAETAQRSQGDPVPWNRPAPATSSLFRFQALETAFRRTAANQQCVDAVKDPKAPGTTGDIVAGTTMIEALACLERAYRMRHTMRRPRAVAHAASRLRGHGDPNGAFGRNGVEYVRQILKQARAKL